MIGIYTYSLIFIALALMIALIGIIKVTLFTGAGMPASHCTGAIPPTGTYYDASPAPCQMRKPFTANALYAAVGNSFPLLNYPSCPLHSTSARQPQPLQTAFAVTETLPFHIHPPVYQNSNQ